MATLAQLVVKLRAESTEFHAGLNRAAQATQRFGGRLDRLNKSVERTTAQWTQGAFSRLIIGGGLVYGFKKAFDAVDEFDAAQRRLAATAKITGTSLGFLEGVASGAKDEFRLSTRLANDLTVELGKLTGKAGDLSVASDALRAFLDLGAARGLNAEQTLQSVRQAILGIDEGTDKLFNANPSVLYERYADAIGVSVGKLTDQQKAQAIVNAALEDGGKVVGQYADFLESAAGRSATLAVRSEEAAVALGKAVEPLRLIATRWATAAAQKVSEFVGGIQIMALELDAFFFSIPARVEQFIGNAMANIASFFHRLNQTLPQWVRDILGTDKEDQFLIKVAAAGVNMADRAAAEIRTIFDALDEERQRVLRDMGVLGGGTGSPGTLPGGAGAGGAGGGGGSGEREADPVVRMADSMNRATLASEPLIQKLRVMREHGDRLASTAQSIAFAFSDSLVNALHDGRSAFRAFVDYAVDQLLRLAARFAVFQGLKALFPTSAFVAGLGEAFGFGGARARGGPVRAGEAYLVGEKGPEMYVPDRSGSIVPNGAVPSIVINVPPARDPISFARDADWQKAIRETLDEAAAQGYAFGGA